MTEQRRREADSILIEMASQLGGLQQAVDSGSQDRRDLWAKVNENQALLGHKIDKLTTAVTSIAEGMKAVPQMAAQITTLGGKVSDLEEGPKRRTWMVAGGAAVFGILGYEHVPSWFKAFSTFVGGGGGAH